MAPRLRTVTSPVLLVLLISVSGSLAAPSVGGGEPNPEPNPPVWPDSVLVFDAKDASSTQNAVNRVFAEQGGHKPAWHGQFSSARWALLFKPGSHAVDVNVGYYTSVVGLGATPSDTTIRNVICENGDFNFTGGALDNFWRSAENFATAPTRAYNSVPNSMLWAVSQAAPLRRVEVNGNLQLYEYNYGGAAGYASGGFMADSRVSGTIYSGSQQQWILRNSDARWNGGVYNIVLLGNTGTMPASHCGNKPAGTPPITTVPSTPVIAEKPYVAVDGSHEKFQLRVPPVLLNHQGPTRDAEEAVIDFSSVFVANANHSAATINAKLASGLHLLLTPGTYQLDAPIEVSRPGTVVLGIGFPTLVSANGTPVLVVANGAGGVRVAGVLLEAGATRTPTLLQWGSAPGGGRRPGGIASAAGEPGFLYDCFARVGGPNDPALRQVRADSMVTINSDNVVLDNLWLWRADHGVGGVVRDSMNPCLHGLVVRGSGVVAYGLAVEHTLQDLVQWSGDQGRVFFFQSELPYDVTQAEFGAPGYTGFRVSAPSLEAWGVGCYSFFRDHAVSTSSGIVVANTTALAGGTVKFHNSLSVFLNGLGNIEHVLNSEGASVDAAGEQSYLCEFP